MKVYCDYDLLKKARDGEINIPPTASVSNPAGGKYFRLVHTIEHFGLVFLINDAPPIGKGTHSLAPLVVVDGLCLHGSE